MKGRGEGEREREMKKLETGWAGGVDRTKHDETALGVGGGGGRREEEDWVKIVRARCYLQSFES